MPQIISIIQCVPCRSLGLLSRSRPLDDPTLERERRERITVLSCAAIFLEGLRVRGNTHRNHLTGVRAYLNFASSQNLLAFPSHPEDLVAFLNHEVLIRQIEGGTAASYLDGVDALHQRLLSLGLIQSNPCAHQSVKDAKHTISLNYKSAFLAKNPLTIAQLKRMLAVTPANSRRSSHIRLTIMLIAVGCIRTGAASVIEAHYLVENGEVSFLPTSHINVMRCPTTRMRYLHVQVRADKNRDPSMPTREVFLPDHIPELDLHPIQEVLDYLREHRPSSKNKFLLALPYLKGNRWSSYKPNKFGVTVGHRPNALLREVILKAFPTMSQENLKGYGTTSLRKCLAQTITNDGWPPHVLMDMGGWARDKQSIDAYQTTPLSVRLMILAHLGQRLGPTYYARA